MRTAPPNRGPVTLGGAAAVTIIAWASAFPMIRVGMRDFAPGPFALLRLAVGSVVLAVAAAAGKRSAAVRATDLGPLALAGLVGVAVYQVALGAGERTVTAGTASLLIGTAPLFTTLFAAILLRERPQRSALIGLFVGFGGAATLASRASGGLRLDAGVVAVLVAAVAHASYFVLQRRQLARLAARDVASWTVWLGTACLLPFTPALLRELPSAAPVAIAAAVYLGAVATALAHVTWALVLARVPAGQAATMLYAVPPVALLIGWLWLNEAPDPLAVGGGALALGGAFVVTLDGRRVRGAAHHAVWQSPALATLPPYVAPSPTLLQASGANSTHKSVTPGTDGSRS